uniref:Uncharacterized protein n=1 Tax=Octopus bimaculoides TaxID=37653 RepID=A0A0L8I4B8_OCTBM
MDPNKKTTNDSRSNNITPNTYDNHKSQLHHKFKRKHSIWLNIPYNYTVSTNIYKKFMDILQKNFDPNHRYYKIFSQHTIRISYSTLPNIGSIINKLNKKNTELARTLENKNCLIIDGNTKNYQTINNTNATNNHVHDNTNTNNTVNTSEEIHNENPNNNSINNNNNSNDHLNGSDDNTRNSYETNYNTSNPLNINRNQLNEHNNTSTVNIVDEINLPSSNNINCISSNTTNDIDIINYDNSLGEAGYKRNSIQQGKPKEIDAYSKVTYPDPNCIT